MRFFPAFQFLLGVAVCVMDLGGIGTRRGECCTRIPRGKLLEFSLDGWLAMLADLPN